MQYHFFAMISRMKYINRWALMRNTQPENLSEHAMEVACIAHALAVISNKRFAGTHNAERCALLGLYHDAPECLTGDLPTPVKYFSKDVRKAYQSVEENAVQQMLTMLPEDLREAYVPCFIPQDEDTALWRFVKAADKLSALVKCISEENAGNSEFSIAATSLRQTIDQMQLPEAAVFLEEFLPSFSYTLDEMKQF